jgi:uncharacterized protein YjhX (UPF0386 family)
MTNEMCVCGHPLEEHKRGYAGYDNNVACYHKDGLMYCNCGDFMSVETFNEMQKKKELSSAKRGMKVEETEETGKLQIFDV